MTSAEVSVPTRVVGLLVRLTAAVGLAIDAYVHFTLAGDFDAIKGTVSQGDLFRAEAATASVVALLVLLAAGRRWVYPVTAAVAGSGLGAVLLYRYVNVGALGPLPNMYEPVWYFNKSLSAIGEATAFAAAMVGFVVQWRSSARTGQRPSPGCRDGRR